MIRTHVSSLLSLYLASVLTITGCGQDSAHSVGTPAQDTKADEGTVSALSTIPLSVSESASWPKTVQWCGAGGHEAHGSYQWSVSWGSNQTTTANCMSYSSASEVCGLSARVLTDNLGHTSVDTPYDLFDHRSISLSPTSYSVAVHQSVSLVAPAPHGTRHCDGTGQFIWQVLSGGVWTDIASSLNVTPWSTSSPTAGTETYRLKSTHQNNTSYSNSVTVTWSSTSTPPEAQVQCVRQGSTQVSCTGSVYYGGTPPYTAYWKVGTNGTWQQGSMTQAFPYQYNTFYYFKVLDAASNWSYEVGCKYGSMGWACFV
jgi:hypothetical protein